MLSVSLHGQSSDCESSASPAVQLPESTRPDPEPRSSAKGPRPSQRLLAWAFRLPTIACFGISILLIAIAIAFGSIGPSWLPGILGITGAVCFCLSILVALARVVLRTMDLARALREPAEIAPTLAAMLGNLVMAGFGTLVAYFATIGFSRGRQLRRRGKVLLPDLTSDASWTSAATSVDPVEAPLGLADQWRENGKTEHASVAAFARLTLDLMALGAPPALVASANRDALDEIRHTELCFSLAYALDGRRVSPGPFPAAQRVATLPGSRTLALAKLAVDSLVDGALHEGVSARIIAKLAQRSDVLAIRAVLKEIAADEGRHAAHGWTVVEWCLDQGGRPVANALLGAIGTLPTQTHSQLPEPAIDGGWEKWGIHGRTHEAHEYFAARAHIVQRVQRMVVGRSSQAA